MRKTEYSEKCIQPPGLDVKSSQVLTAETAFNTPARAHIPAAHAGYGGGEIQRYVIQFGVARRLLEERPWFRDQHVGEWSVNGPAAENGTKRVYSCASPLS